MNFCRASILYLAAILVAAVLAIPIADGETFNMLHYSDKFLTAWEDAAGKVPVPDSDKSFAGFFRTHRSYEGDNSARW